MMKVYLTSFVGIPGWNFLELKIFSSREKAEQYKENLFTKILEETPGSKRESFGIVLPNGRCSEILVSEHEVL